ncbi:MAG: hypothetical protein Q4D60_03575 [Eubacteriales bacterium]|nr:hypothetical protein [Eubacteriales bacterium]
MKKRRIFSGDRVEKRGGDEASFRCRQDSASAGRRFASVVTGEKETRERRDAGRKEKKP